MQGWSVHGVRERNRGEALTRVVNAKSYCFLKDKMAVFSFTGFLMAYRLRIQSPQGIYFITTRCVGAQHLLRPDKKCCDIVLACLCRAVHTHKIQVYGYVFMSNHFHLLCGAPGLNLSAFLQELNSSIARRVNRHRGRQGVFFGERYTKVDILSAEKAFETLIYLLMNPCAAGLVTRPKEYPGVSSYAHHLSGEKVRGHWLDVKRYHRNRKRNSRVCEQDYVTRYEFELVPLPHLRDLNWRAYAQRIQAALARRCKQLKRLQRAAGKTRVFGAKRCTELDPFSAPVRPKRSGYAACMGTGHEQIRAYHEHCQMVTGAYRRARRLDCRAVRHKSVLGVCYPPGTIPPGCRRCVPYG